jgi:dimethylargininase
MLIALTRAISPRMAECELTHLERTPIDVARAEAQHRAYEAALESLGCRVERIDPLPEMADSVFVEDTAVVLDEVALITRPGAESRRGETPSVAAALRAHRPLLSIEAPGILDGGDVLRLGRRLFVGLSRRSDARAVGQMQRLLAPLGYQVRGVEVHGCLHLKTAVTQLDDRTVLINPDWVDASSFGAEAIEVHPEEPMAANVLRVGARLLYPEAFPRTRERLEARGYPVTTLDVSELARAEGALTCCSLIFSAS